MPNTRGIKAGRAFVELGTSDKLSAGLKRAQAKLKAFGQSVQSIGLRIAAVGGAALAGFGVAAKVFAATGDTLDKMSKRTGFAAEALSELGFAAEQSGADAEILEKGIRGFQMVLRNAERGLSRAQENLASLGLTFEDLKGLAPEQQFNLLADRLAAIEDPTRRAGIAMQVMGNAGQQLLPLMADGAAGMEALRRRARDLGITMTSTDTTAAAALTDALNELFRVAKRVAVVIGGAVAEDLTAMATLFAETAGNVIRFLDANREMIRIVGKVAVGITGVGGTILAFGLALKGVAFSLGGLATAFTVLVNPVTVVSGLLAGLGYLLSTRTEVGRKSVAALGRQFLLLKNTVGGVIGDIIKVLSGGEFKAAAEVAGAGIEVAFRATALEVLKVWNRFRAAWAEITVGVFRIAEDIAYAIERVWVQAIGELKRRGSVQLMALGSGFVELYTLARKAATLINAVRFQFNPGQIFKEIDAEAKAMRQRLAGFAADLIGQTNEQQQGALKRRATEHEELVKALGRHLRDALDALDDDTRDAEKKLEDAIKRLADVRQKARELAERTGKPGGIVGISMMVEDAMRTAMKRAADRMVAGGFDAAVGADRRLAAAGTFASTRLASMFGTGRNAELDQLKRIEGHLEEIKRRRERVF